MRRIAIPAQPRIKSMPDAYSIVIGLEVHVRLLTESKMFCACGTKFGEPPNTRTCPVCAGLPGALPTINRRAFELALRTAVALNCRIAGLTRWDRKNYFYPDLPKGYQISQYALPIGSDGWLEIEDARDIARRIGILRVHLEEDAGKSMHDEGGPDLSANAERTPKPSRIDLNRAGTPLLEIVSRPDLRHPAEAKKYLAELKLLLNYLGVSDCNMEEGSLRVDANVNLHIDTPRGTVATPIVEVKNMNSFRAVERALAHEAERQWREWQTTGRNLGDAPKATRGWDEASRTTRLQREKEESSDYRYFPDPDLPPVVVATEEIECVRASLGELPAALRKRLERDYGVPSQAADVLVHQGRALVDYFSAVARACGDGRAAANWMRQDVLRWLAERRTAIERYPVPPASLAELIGRVRAGAFEAGRARDVLGEMAETGRSLDEAIRSLGIVEVDDATLSALCRRVVAANPDIAAEVRAGKLKGLGSLVGQVKRENPNVNPARVGERCRRLIDEAGG